MHTWTLGRSYGQLILAVCLVSLPVSAPLARADEVAERGGRSVERADQGTVPPALGSLPNSSLSEQIASLRHRLKHLDTLEEQTTGTSAAVSIALGMLATGITSHLLNAVLRPGLQPLAQYQSAVGNRYLRAALQGLIHMLIPSILGGSWMSVMVESGQTPALPMEDTALPLLTGIATLELSSLGYTWLSARANGYSGEQYYSPTPAVLLNSVVVLTGLTLWSLGARIDKQYAYSQLQLQLADLHRRLAALQTSCQGDD